MKIGKGLPDGAVYTIPQANNTFAKKDEITDIESSLDQISGDVDLLSADVESLNEKIPTPEAADAGKVLTVNDSGSYVLQTAEGKQLNHYWRKATITLSANKRTATVTITDTYNKKVYDVCGIYHYIDGIGQDKNHELVCNPAIRVTGSALINYKIQESVFYFKYIGDSETDVNYTVYMFVNTLE